MFTSRNWIVFSGESVRQPQVHLGICWQRLQQAGMMTSQTHQLLKATNWDQQEEAVNRWTACLFILWWQSLSKRETRCATNSSFGTIKLMVDSCSSMHLTANWNCSNFLEAFARQCTGQSLLRLRAAVAASNIGTVDQVIVWQCRKDCSPSKVQVHLSGLSWLMLPFGVQTATLDVSDIPALGHEDAETQSKEQQVRSLLESTEDLPPAKTLQDESLEQALQHLTSLTEIHKTCEALKLIITILKVWKLRLLDEISECPLSYLNAPNL